jgi:GAF domain-containing protein
MTTAVSVDQVLATLRELAAAIEHAGSADEQLQALTNAVLRMLPNADGAGVTCVSADGFESVAPTSDLAERIDNIQFDVGSGPCIDAAVQAEIFRTGDLRADERWPEFGRRAADETGVLSMMSFRLFLERDDDLAAALNVYSTQRDAFDDAAQLAGLAASTYGAALVSGKRHRDEAQHLQRALESNREIGAAIGVLMAHHKVTREQGFDLLRLASQNTHRKLIDIARDVVDTGTLGI